MLTALFAKRLQITSEQCETDPSPQGKKMIITTIDQTIPNIIACLTSKYTAVLDSVCDTVHTYLPNHTKHTFQWLGCFSSKLQHTKQ